MRLVVNDSSALIDLKKGGLLELLVELPFEFVVSDALVADELLSFTKNEVAFIQKRMTVVSLDAEEMVKVARTKAASPALSLHDCLALIIARRETGCILLSGDRRLRAKAEADKVNCNGILWVVEELLSRKLAAPKALLKVLEIWKGDITVRLPARELEEALLKLKA